jgi:hypothetical protein
MFFIAVTFFIVVLTLQDLDPSRKSPSNNLCLMPSSLGSEISPLNSLKTYSPQPVLAYFLTGSLSYSVYLQTLIETYVYAHYVLGLSCRQCF